MRDAQNELAPLAPIDTSSLPKIDMMKFVDTQLDPLRKSMPAKQRAVNPCRPEEFTRNLLHSEAGIKESPPKSPSPRQKSITVVVKRSNKLEKEDPQQKLKNLCSKFDDRTSKQYANNSFDESNQPQ